MTNSVKSRMLPISKQEMQETSSGAVSQSYDSLQESSQMRNSTDLVNSEVFTVVKRVARSSHSAALAQLASKMSVVMHMEVQSE